MTTTTTTWMGMALLWLLACTNLVHVHGQTSFKAPSNDDDATTYTGFHSTTPMPFARSDMKANLIDVAYPDYATKGPRIFLVGGCVANQACNLQGQCNFNCLCPQITNLCNYYTPLTGEWFGCAPAPVPRYMHATAVVNSKLYLSGGRDIAGNMITTIDVYDPLKNTWTTPTALTWPGATCNHQAFSMGNTMYLVGGYNVTWFTNGPLQSVDVTTGKWLNLPPMRVPRGDIRAVTNDRNTYYILGGFVAPNFCAPVNTVETYNVGTNTWGTAPPMLLPRGDPSAGALGKYIFALGGETITPSCAYSVPVRNVSRYDPRTKKWVYEATLPEDLFRFTSASYNSTSRQTRAIYLFGGQGRFHLVNASYGYYPIKNSAIVYIPASLYPNSSPAPAPALSGGGIAGIVIGVLVAVACFACGIVSGCAYRSRFYTLRDQTQDGGVSAEAINNGGAADTAAAPAAAPAESRL